jgi:hypothetical protein
MDSHDLLYLFRGDALPGSLNDQHFGGFRYSHGGHARGGPRTVIAPPTLPEALQREKGAVVSRRFSLLLAVARLSDICPAARSLRHDYE